MKFFSFVIGFTLFEVAITGSNVTSDTSLSDSKAEEQKLDHFNSVLLGLTSVERLSPKIQSKKCLQDFHSLFNITDPRTGLSLGALALDASGKIGSGIYRGNTYALGDYDGCLDMGEYLDLVHYCVVPVTLVPKSAERMSVTQFLVGMCVPPSCSLDEDLEDLLQQEAQIFSPLKHHFRGEVNDAMCTL